MKTNKKIFFMATIYCLSMHSFAITGHGYKILSETIKSSPGFNFHVEENNGTKLAGNYASATTTTVGKQGSIRQHVQIDGYHNVVINNKTKNTQIYEYTYNLHCENSYGQYTRYIQVNPEGNFTTSDHSIGDVMKEQPGAFRIDANTKIAGESKDYSEAHAVLRIR